MSGSTLYVGGQFTILGGRPRFNVGAIDLGTRSVTAWNPGPSGGEPPTDGVRAITVTAGSGPVFLGGGFTDIGRASGHSFVAKVGLSRG